MCTQPSSGTAELEQLAAELSGQGYQTQLVTADGRLPYLHVRNPRVAMLTENVYATDGYYWFGWAERIAETGDMTAAAAKLAHVLRAVDPE